MYDFNVFECINKDDYINLLDRLEKAESESFACKQALMLTLRSLKEVFSQRAIQPLLDRVNECLLNNDNCEVFHYDSI